MAATRGLTGRRRARRGRVLGCFVAALVAMTWGGATANATIIERDTFTNHFDDVRWDCGYPMTVAHDESSSVLIRADKKLADFVFLTNNFDFKEVWTAADGRFFTITGSNLFKDIKIKSVGGSLYEGKFNISGQPFTIADSAGRVVARDRGNLSFDYTIDFADGTFNVLDVKFSGPHATDMCKVVAALVGSGSDRYLTERPIGSTAFLMGYDEYLPPSYSASGSPSPLLIFLNGYGENGDGTPDGIHILVAAGIPRLIDVGGWPTDRPLVVLALQHVDPGFDWSPCDNVPWGGSCGMQIQHDQNHVSPAPCTTPDEVHEFITYAVAHYNVDLHRVYVTGLSCGGFGAWEYVAKYGDAQVAAAVPIAGEGRPAWGTAGCALGSVPLWAFHGALDDVVNPQGSIVPMTALAACPGVPADQAKLTIYPEADHDSWDRAYSGSEGDDIYSWMLGFSKP